MEGFALAWRVIAAVGVFTAVVALAGLLVNRVAAGSERGGRAAGSERSPANGEGG